MGESDLHDGNFGVTETEERKIAIVDPSGAYGYNPEYLKLEVHPDQYDKLPGKPDRFLQSHASDDDKEVGGNWELKAEPTETQVPAEKEAALQRIKNMNLEDLGRRLTLLEEAVAAEDPANVEKAGDDKRFEMTNELMSEGPDHDEIPKGDRSDTAKLLLDRLKRIQNLSIA